MGPPFCGAMWLCAVLGFVALPRTKSARERTYREVQGMRVGAVNESWSPIDDFAIDVQEMGLDDLVQEALGVQPEIKIDAVTWNAGNKELDSETLKKLSAVTAQSESDLFVVGFQEVQSNEGLMNTLSGQHLWQHHGRSSLLRERIQSMTPHEVEDAISDILRNFAHFTSVILDHVSKISTLLLEDQPSVADWKPAIDPEKYTARDEATVQRVDSLIAQLNAIASLTKDHNAPIGRAAWKSIHAFASGLRRESLPGLLGLPNILGLPIDEKWAEIMGEQKTKAQFTLELQMLGKTMSTEIELIIEGLKAKYIPRGHAARAMPPTPRSNTPFTSHSLRLAITKWNQRVKESFWNFLPTTRLLKRAPTVDDVSPPPLSERWTSSKCRVVGHYDTAMYIYVNPFSSWHVEVHRHESSACKNSGNDGCTINNNAGSVLRMKWECGKVVNLIRFVAIHTSGAKQQICFLNTHMSFSGSVERRARKLANAMQEADNANCNVVAFLGDFNTRMHCGPGVWGLPPKMPKNKIQPENQLVPLWTQPVYQVLQSCRDGAETVLGENCKAHDELYQMLSEEQVHCFAGGKSKGWHNEVTQSRVWKYNYKEVAPPLFSPTYKHTTCNQEDQRMARLCYQTDEEPKHSPAWTDRILVAYDTKSVELVVHKYDAIRPQLAGSDHLPVVASVALRFLDPEQIRATVLPLATEETNADEDDLDDLDEMDW